MNQQNPEEYNKAKRKELMQRVEEELKAYDKKNFLECYALYMFRIQMYEMSLKRDLQELFEVDEEKAERMNLSSIFRYFVEKDVRAHPILYVNVKTIARQRNTMAHEFLAMATSMSELAGTDVMRFFEKDLNRWSSELEFAFQQYLMLKETDMLYKDWGVKPSYDIEG